MKKMNLGFLALFLISSFCITKAMFTSLKRFTARYYPAATRSIPKYPTSPSGSGQQIRWYSSPRIPTSTVSQTPSQAPAAQGWWSRLTSSVQAYFDPEGARIAEEKARKEELQRRFDEEVMNFQETIAHNPFYVYVVNRITALRAVGKTPEEINRLQPIDWNRVIMTLGYHNPDTLVKDTLQRELINTINSTTCETVEDIQKLYDAYFAYVVVVPGLFSERDLKRDGASQAVKDVMDTFWSKHIMGISFDNVPLSLEERLAVSEPVMEYFNTPEANRVSFVAQLKKEDRDILMEAKEKGINTDRQFMSILISANKKLDGYRNKLEDKVKTIQENFHQRVENEILKPRRDALKANAESFAARTK